MFLIWTLGTQNKNTVTRSDLKVETFVSKINNCICRSRVYAHYFHQGISQSSGVKRFDILTKTVRESAITSLISSHFISREKETTPHTNVTWLCLKH